MTRRQFGMAALAGTSVTGAPGQAGRAAAWQIGNGTLVQKLGLEDGRFRCASLFDPRAGREWIHPALTSLEFSIELRTAAGPLKLSGEGPWDAAGEERLADGPWRVLRIELRHRAYPFSVTREYRVHESLPVLRARSILHNRGAEAASITRVDCFHLRVAPSPEPLELHWINNFGRAMHPVPGNPIRSCAITENAVQTVRTGPYSPDLGWFSLVDAASDETLTGGWEWSGPMVVSFGDQVDPCLIHGGLDPAGMHEPLAPGQQFSAPVVWYGFAKGDEARIALSHGLVSTALGPPLPKADFPWMGYCTWACSLDKKSPYNEPGTDPWFPTEHNLLSQSEAAANAGCEMYLWDYGWFPRVGDWWSDPKRFPNGPRAVIDDVKRRRMKLGLWFGFGNADADSTVAREHPNWLAVYGGAPIPDRFFTRTGASVWNTRVLCLAHRPAREWVKQQIARVIDDFELDWFKHDFDLITICDSKEHTHTPGDSRVEACAAFYEIMDFVRARYPGLVCENWVNNSAVPDYGSLQRHHVQLIGDAYKAFSLRQMFYGHLRVYPADRQHRYVRFEDSEGDLKAMLRSGLMGGPCTLLTDIRTLAGDQRRELAAEIERYKKWRAVFASGRTFFPLGRPHPRSWDATEFFDARAGRGIVFVFRNDHADGSRRIAFAGPDPTARYRVQLVDARQERTVAGAVLRAGIDVAIPARNRSEIVLVERS